MLVTVNYDIYLIQNKIHYFEFRNCNFHLFINSYYFYLKMPRKTRHLIIISLNKRLTSKLEFSPNFTLDSVADSN
jgi:hypothetical protein